MMVASWPRLAGILAVLLIGGNSALASQKLTLAAGQSDKPSYAAGVGLSSLIKFELLPSRKIDLQVLATTGAVDNVRKLQSGKAELAIIPSIVGHAARTGMGSFHGDPPETAFRAIAALWRDALHLVVREDDVRTGTLDDFLGMTNRRVFLGDVSSGIIDANQRLLADLGLNIDEAFKSHPIADGEGISAIRRGEIDALSMMARPPKAAFDGIFRGDAAGLRLLDVTESQMTRANGNHWLWTPYVIPADTYPGQRDDVWTIGFSNILVARAEVDPEVVYEITKSIFENVDYLRRVDPLMDDLSLDKTLAGVAMPLHAGALRYYQEAGLLSKPASSDREGAPINAPKEEKKLHPPASPDRYPSPDVAGDWPAGSGGPLLKAPPALDPVKEPHERPTSAHSPKPEAGPAAPPPHWQRRAML